MATRFMLSCALGLSAFQAAGAAEWSAAPVLSWSVDHDSNRVLEEEATASQGGTVRLEAQLRRAAPNLQLTVQPSVSLHRFTNDGALDSDDRAVNLSSVWLHEHSKWSTSAGLYDESTLTSELTDAGLVAGDTRRRFLSASSSWQLQYSEQQTFQMAVAYADVSYQGQQADRLPGYRYPSLTLTNQLMLSERASTAFIVFTSRLKSENDFGDSRDGGVSVAADYAFSEHMQLHATFGYSSRKISGVIDTGYIGNIQLTRNTELGSWDVFYRRKLSASGLGLLLERDEAGFNVQRSLNPMLSARLGVFAVRNDTPAFSASGERRRYEIAETGLDWRTGETSVLGMRVSARRAQQSIQADLTESWRVSAVFTWTPQPQTISR